MIKLAGYQIQEQIHESKTTIIYKGFRDADQQPVIFKMLKKEYPSPEEIARFKREYELTHSLNINGVTKVHGLEKYKNSLVMIAEDFGGNSIKNHLMSHKLSLEQFFHLSIRITEILDRIHSQNIMHKDVNPSNIIWNSKTDELEIIDFGISTELFRETVSMQNPDVLEGTLAYMSPEQTGRMNRSIDYRTDFYSLGVTFYEILTGILPFSATDPIELVHCHIAKTPLIPTEVNQNIPYALSKILIKLMEKTAEDRYQTTFGIKWDLQQCFNYLKTNESSNTFQIGQRDVSDQFQIPQKLYGREEEVKNLLTAFEDMSKNGVTLMLVAGYSGVGKSALVHEVHKSITQKKGYFIDGKFDQFQRNIPYSALIRSFQSLTLQILSEPSARLKYWKDRLLDSFGSNGQIIVDLIPEMEKIVGRQPNLVELNPTDATNRFSGTLLNFIKALAESDHPLVIFLDDLQWSDIPTLNLIQSLVTSKEIQNLFLIGAYRNNEVTEGHPLKLTTNEIEKTNLIHHLFLKPLSVETVNQILSDTLHYPRKDTKSLAELIYRKTEGNPFFVNTLLKSLYKEGYIYFFHEERRWDWDIGLIQEFKVSENVVEFMIQELQKLSQKTQDVIQLASCLGNRFDLKTLSKVYKNSLSNTAAALWEALKKEIIIPLDNKYLLVQEESVDETKFDFGVNYKFAHDRIQQAAYSLIQKDRIKDIHLLIGRILRPEIEIGVQEENLIELVGHLNEGRTLITDSGEREDLVRLNIVAAKKAKASTAFRSGLQYLAIGKTLLVENSWNLQYELTFELFQEYTACAYLCGEYELAETNSETLLINSKTRLEKAKIRSMQLVQYSYGRKMGEANRAGILGLRLLGIKISEKPNMLSILREILLAKINLGKRKIEDLINQPIITDLEVKLAMRILIDFIPPAYLTGNSNLFALVVLKQANLSLRYGNSPEAASVYASYAVLLTGLGDLQSANKFGKLALQLNARFDDLESKCRTLTLYTIFCQSWNHHWKTLRAFYSQAIDAGLQSGDLLFMAHSCYYVMLYDPEIRLDAAIEQYKKYISLIESSPYQDALDLIMIHQAYRLKLRDGLSEATLESPDISEFRLKRMTENLFLSGVANHHIYQLMTYFTYEDYPTAWQHIQEGDKVIHTLAGSIFTVDFCLYSFLTLAALFPEMSFFERWKAWRRIKKCHKQMKKWATHCPINFLHMQILMEAEIARLSGKTQEASQAFDLAIHTAQYNDYPHFLSLINELAGKFYLSLKQERFAGIYMRDAHYGYTRWGANGKVHHLEKSYSQLFLKVESDQKNFKDTASTSFTGETDSKSLDLTSVIKGALAISSEISRDMLLRKMLSVAMENAGAQRGIFILNQDGQLKIEAEGVIGKETVINLESISIDSLISGEKMPLSPFIVRYVEKTGNALVLNDATKEGQFIQDEYVLANKPRSILCAPIMHQNKLTGIIYLENNLTTGAFTEDRIDVLKVLSAQAAISIENSLLYANLEEKVMERANQLEDAHKKILVLEKETTEKQLAGGFAHEMRNALVGPKLVIQHMLGQDGKEPYESLGTLNSRKLKDIYFLIKELVPAETLQDTLKAMKVIFENEEQMDNNLKMIQRAVSKGLSITQLIMDYSKVGNELAGKDQINLNTILNSIVSDYKKKWLGNKINIQLDLTSKPCQLQGLESHFESVYKNLLINAWDAVMDISIDSQIEKLIQIKTQVLESIFQFEITDNGIGISKENINKIYDAFYSTKPDTGTGLGLGVVKKIITLYNGKIEVSSELGKGTTFRITIPLKLGS